MQINMIGLFTDQFDEMKAFYRDVLGFEIADDRPKYVEFSGQPLRFAICEREVMKDTTGYEGYQTPASGTPFEMAFECESPTELEQQFEKLLEQGAVRVKAPADMPWGQYAAFFADPDGHVHELFVRS
ncbi:VOC family protein [Adhaeretor mobilis]|uniref:Glyoxalase-like domain protein n=1 Tax=Adhaeretor mobilis TaxID=1930276 RepID=A0A517MZ43_9BACT|nr:VOC family protein [Adhaeretor mobilis]QDT00135.1 Glyoxalase-like domain protein [Adhaeretor mobilis]